VDTHGLEIAAKDDSDFVVRVRRRLDSGVFSTFGGHLSLDGDRLPTDDGSDLTTLVADLRGLDLPGARG
jgi:hypothetical protein